MNNFLANTTLGGGHGTDNELLISTAANIIQIEVFSSVLSFLSEPLEPGDTGPRN